MARLDRRAGAGGRQPSARNRADEADGANGATEFMRDFSGIAVSSRNISHHLVSSRCYPDFLIRMIKIYTSSLASPALYRDHGIMGINRRVNIPGTCVYRTYTKK
jgi:hypothetical protein